MKVKNGGNNMELNNEVIEDMIQDMPETDIVLDDEVIKEMMEDHEEDNN